MVTKAFIKEKRARYMGIWSMMITVEVSTFATAYLRVCCPSRRISMDILGSGHGKAYISCFCSVNDTVVFLPDIYDRLFLIYVQVNAVQFILYIFFNPETVYVQNSSNRSHSSFKTEYLTFRRIDPRSFTTWEFIEPLSMVRHAFVIIPSAAYSMVFLFDCVLVTVEIPELFQEKFGFTPEQLGLQFIGIIVGSLLGEQLGGPLSDYWMTRRACRIHKRPSPEFRLWLSYIGFLLTIVGVAFLARTEQAPHGHWNITPVIGVATAAFGN